MDYFTTPGELRKLDDALRGSSRGSYVKLTQGITQYELRGPDDGELVVLVGGLTVPLDAADPVAALLHERGFRTLAYSCFGRGYSDRVKVPYDQPLFSTQLAELLQALRLPATHHVLGSSMGALIALAYAGEHPRSVETLTLVGPAGLARPSAIQLFARRARFLMPSLGRALGPRLLRSHTRRNVGQSGLQDELGKLVSDAFEVEGSMHALISTLSYFRLDGRGELFAAARNAPYRRLLVWGETDEVTPVRGYRLAVELMRPDASHILPGCGHMVGMEQPQTLVEKFVEFARRGRGIA